MKAEIATIRRLLAQLSQKRKRQLLLGVPALALLVALLDLLLLLHVARLLEVLNAATALPVQAMALKVIGLAWLLAMARTVARRQQFTLAATAWADLSERVFGALLRRPYSFFVGRSRAALVGDLQEELPEVAPLLITQLVLLVANGCSVVLLTLGLCWLAGPSALLLMLVLVVAYGLLAQIIRGPLRRWQARQSEAAGQLRDLVADALLLIRELRLRGEPDGVLGRQQLLNSELAAALAAGEALPERPRLLLEPLGLTAVLLLLLLPQVRSTGANSLPWLALITLGLIRLAQPLQEIWRALNLLHTLQPRLAHLLELLTPAELEPTSDRGARPRITSTFGLAGVWFRHKVEHTWLLRNMSLELPQRGLVGLVGASGAGKSTVAALLLGLLQPERGNVVLDGQPLPWRDIGGWRRQCAEVSQPVRLLSGSVAENLHPWGPELPEEKLWCVLEEVGMAEVVRALPAGLASGIGHDGEQLSGGQRQRLALARALLRRPRLLVLDEATSGLDPASEAAIGTCVSQLVQSPGPAVTVLVVAHSVAMMRRCERLHLLVEGQVAASGSFRELAEGCEAFRALLAHQPEPGALPEPAAGRGETHW